MNGRLPSLVGLCVALVAVGCNGNDDEKSDGGGEAASKGPTEVDLKIARIVDERGDPLAVSSTFYGDARLLEGTGLKFVAPTRVRIARKMQADAKKASAELKPLVPQATTAKEVAELGQKAFAGFEKCAADAVQFFSGATKGSTTTADIPRARKSCDDADDLFDSAKAAIERLPKPAEQTTTGGAAGAGETVKVVLKSVDTDDPQRKTVNQPVAPGAKVNIVYSARNTSGFKWNLRKDCKGPLTFEVNLNVVTPKGSSPVLDTATAGYTGPGPAKKKGVRAKVTGAESFELDAGTFTVPDEASGASSVLLTLANNRCPDPVSGTSYSPISVTGVPETLVLPARD